MTEEQGGYPEDVQEILREGLRSGDEEDDESETKPTSPKRSADSVNIYEEAWNELKRLEEEENKQQKAQKTEPESPSKDEVEDETVDSSDRVERTEEVEEKNLPAAEESVMVLEKKKKEEEEEGEEEEELTDNQKKLLAFYWEFVKEKFPRSLEVLEKRIEEVKQEIRQLANEAKDTSDLAELKKMSRKAQRMYEALQERRERIQKLSRKVEKRISEKVEESSVFKKELENLKKRQGEDQEGESYAYEDEERQKALNRVAGRFGTLNEWLMSIKSRVEELKELEDRNDPSVKEKNRKRAREVFSEYAENPAVNMEESGGFFYIFEGVQLKSGEVGVRIISVVPDSETAPAKVGDIVTAKEGPEGLREKIAFEELSS